MKKLFILFVPICLLAACKDPEFPDIMCRVEGKPSAYYPYKCKGEVMVEYGCLNENFQDAAMLPSVDVECNVDWIKNFSIRLLSNKRYSIQYDVEANANADGESHYYYYYIDGLSASTRSGTVTVFDKTCNSITKFEVAQYTPSYYREAHHWRSDYNGNTYLLAFSDNGWNETSSGLQTKASSWYVEVVYYDELYMSTEPTSPLDAFPNGEYMQSSSQNYGTCQIYYYVTNSANQQTEHTVYRGRFVKDGRKCQVCFEVKDSSDSRYRYSYLIEF